MKIRIIITGGTFDKHYDELKGELTFKDSHLPEILKYVRCTVPIEIEINQLLDSLQFKDSNRMKILESCRWSDEEKLIITHGTDTMSETAELIGKANLEKTIVITGSMVPYSFSQSDALFNLGCAVMAIQLLPPGVFIVMNGRVFKWDNVKKNKELGVFQEVAV
ncbi:asparaginase [bacterium]|nr:asparaginase [bacterium]